jgi:hypothetical protein
VPDLSTLACKFQSISLPLRSGNTLEGVMNLDAEEVASWHGYSKTIPK